MNKNIRAVDSFEIRYSEKEELALNIVNYFLKEEAFSLFNIPEKIIENFSHPLYDLIFVSTDRLHSSEAIIDLENKLKTVKKKIARKYLIPSPKILYISLDCEIDFEIEMLPSHVEFVSIRSLDDFTSNPIILEDFKDIKSANLSHSFSELSKLINKEGILHLRKIKTTLEYAKKPWGYAFLITLNVLWFLIFVYLNVKESGSNQVIPFALSKEGIEGGAYWLFITNSFVSRDILQLLFATVFISYFGRFTEKLYGTVRFIGITLFAIILSNAFSYALSTDHQFGFFPVVIGLISALSYATFNYRRYLMMSFRRMILPFIGIYFFFALLTSSGAELISTFGAFLGGLLGAVIVGLPKKRSNSRFKRIVLLMGFMFMVALSIMTGNK